MHAEKSCRRIPNFVTWVDLVPAGRKLSQPPKCERHRAHVEGPIAFEARQKGASRMSSVLGLKVRPSTATVLPRSAPENMVDTFRAIARFRMSFTAATASMMRKETSWSCAVLISARTSLGRHEPPNPGPACKIWSRCDYRDRYRARLPARQHLPSRKDRQSR
jgi:hypothetical protein